MGIACNVIWGTVGVEMLEVVDPNLKKTTFPPLAKLKEYRRPFDDIRF